MEIPLKKFFGSMETDAVLIVPEDINLNEPIENGPFKKIGINAKWEKKLPVFGEELSLDAEVESYVYFHDAGESVRTFQGLKAATPEGRHFVELAFRPRVTAEMGMKWSLGYWDLSLKADASMDAEYRHLLLCNPGQKRRDAFESVVKSAKLPRFIDLKETHERKIKPYEFTGLHYALREKLKLEAGIIKEYDWEKALPDVHKLLKELKESELPEFKVKAEASIKAGLGFELYDELTWELGKINCVHDDWTRVRISKIHEERLTLGAVIALKAEYDLGSPFISMLEKAMEWSPVKTAMNALADVGKVSSKIKAGEWEAVASELAEKATPLLAQLLGIDELFEELKDSDDLKKILRELNDAVEFYSELDETLKSLWEDLLSDAGVGEDSDIVLRLKEIKGLKGKSIQECIDLLFDDEGNDWSKALDLFETLMGVDIESLVVYDDEKVRETIDKAAEMAEKILKFLEDIPDAVIERFNQFNDETGITAVVQWIEEHTDSVESLQKYAKGQMAKFIERILNKSIELLEPEDLNRIQKWAEIIDELIDKTDEIDDKIREMLEKMKGDMGFSLSLELDRAVRKTALLDVEIDTASRHLSVKVLKALKERKIKRFLKELPGPKDDKESPFILHDCLFTSRKVRTNALNFIWSAFGLEGLLKRTIKRITSTKIEFKESDGQQTREALYSAEMQAMFERNENVLQGGISLQTFIEGKDFYFEGPYDAGTLKHNLNLFFLLDDPESTATNRIFTDIFLMQIGFLGVNPEYAANVKIQKNPPSNLSLRIMLPEKALEPLFSDLDHPNFQVDFLNACTRWLDEPFLRGDDSQGEDGLTREKKMAALMTWEKYHEICEKHGSAGHKVVEELIKLGGAELTIGGKPVTVYFRRDGTNLRPEFIFITELPRMMNELREKMKRFREHLPKKNAESINHNYMVEFINSFASKTLKKMNHKNWNSPLFPLWFIMARLGRSAEDVLKEAEGIAVFSYETDEGMRHLRPLMLDQGLRIDKPGDGKGLFPIKSGD